MSTVKPPLTLPLMRPVMVSFVFQRFFQLVPHHGALGLLARQHGFAEAVLEGVERDLDGVADGDVDLAGVVTELFDRHDAFGLQAGVDHDDVGADFDDDAADDGARLQLGEIGLALLRTVRQMIRSLRFTRLDTRALAAAGNRLRPTCWSTRGMRGRVLSRKTARSIARRSFCCLAMVRHRRWTDGPPVQRDQAPETGSSASTRSQRLRRCHAGGIDDDGVVGRLQGRHRALASRASRARISRSRPSRLTETPLSFNCL